MTLSLMTINTYADCCYTECHYAQCRYAVCCYIEFNYAQCRYGECRYTDFLYAKRRGACLTLTPLIVSFLSPNLEILSYFCCLKKRQVDQMTQRQFGSLFWCLHVVTKQQY
jgi:hypothetical protein